MTKDLAVGIIVVLLAVIVGCAAAASVIAQESIPLMPLTDPQRFSQFKDNLTQTILNDEDQIMKAAYQDQATGRTQAYNDNVKGNNVMVCLDAAHTGDNFTAQTSCDGFISQVAGDVNTGRLTGAPPYFTQAVHDYLKLRGILP
jgi:hypothetical protein